METETLIATHGGHFDESIAISGNTIDRAPENGGNGLGADDSGAMYTLTKVDRHAVAFHVKDFGGDSTIDASPTMGTAHTGLCVAFNAQGSSTQGDGVSEHITPTLDKSKTPAVMSSMQVRRLTPNECEKLQGFPENYTQIPLQSVKQAKLEADYVKYLMRGGIFPKDEIFRISADSPRYKALGNSMSTNVMRCIGERIQMVSEIKDMAAAA